MPEKPPSTKPPVPTTITDYPINKPKEGKP